MEKKQRLAGIDLFRGIAAFAVVILHSDEGIVTQPLGWPAITSFSAFAVPFFLATSFYLTIGKLCASSSPPDWRSRLSRLLIPYGFWSLVYLCQKVLKYFIKNQSDEIKELFQDPLALIFLGQSAFHLYFIPLLLVGTLIVIAVEPLIRNRAKLSVLLGLLILSLLIYQTYRTLLSPWIPDLAAPDAVAQGIKGSLPPEGQGNAFTRLVLVELGYMARCLPYIAAALLLNHSAIRSRLLKLNMKDTVVLLVAFFVFNAFSLPLLPQTVHELLKGYSTLLLALSLSTSLKTNVIITSVGNCSFGIYLMQLLVIDVYWSFVKRMSFFSAQISILNLLTIATLSFLASWIITSALMKQKPIAKLMFGV